MNYNYGRVRKKREAPFSLRLSFEERSRLKAAAGDMPVAAYIKSLLFADDAPVVRRRTRAPVKDARALAELLACLGASRIPNNLNQLARAANSGSLIFDWDTKARIAAACEDIRAMRQLLMEGLGMKQGEEAPARQSPSQCFTRSTQAERAS
jgi:hypothetical protein